MTRFYEIVKAQEASLLRRGYDGLFLSLPNEACGCGVGHLRPCGELNTGCRPAMVDDDGMFRPALHRKAAMTPGGSDR